MRIEGLVGTIKKLYLIAGYSPENIKDKKGLAAFAGKNIILIGLIIILGDVISTIIKNSTIIWISCILVLIVSLNIIIGGQKFTK